MENMVINTEFWRNRNVFLTGHTGFKGGWLALWLNSIGANVWGYSQKPPETPNFCESVHLEHKLKHSYIADIRDFSLLEGAMSAACPSVVFHLAAQPLVRESYADPLGTYSTNIMGTVNLLEAVRRTPSVDAVVVITTDKCYESKEWVWPYRETDVIGGYDPYSSSKSCAELVTAAYRDSFLSSLSIGVVTARAGNVIGGGDWSADRLIPDIIRTSGRGESVRVRSPRAVRPWQHVLDPVAGYLLLAERLLVDHKKYSGSWNFGPRFDDSRDVSWVTDYVCGKIDGAYWHAEEDQNLHESTVLRIDSSKAQSFLGWRSRWPIQRALDATLSWYDAWKAGQRMDVFSCSQISDFNNSEFVEN